MVLPGKVRLRESAADRALLSVEGQAESVRAAFLKHPDYEGAPYKVGFLLHVITQYV